MDEVLNRANYIMGDPVRELEQNLCDFTGAAHAVTCGSGTDALLLAMMALGIGPGDEVITTPFTFIATAETIALLGAKPVFVDIDETTYNIDASKIEAAITEKTKAIIPVSLYGQPADLEEINTIVNRRLKTKNQKLKIIVDGAQSFGATYKGKAEIHRCDIYTTSFFPAKPLGCFGDGGAVLTNDETLAEKMRMLRVHGQNRRYHHKYIGLGARLDTIQAAVLNVKLRHYPEDLKRRQEVASIYTRLLKTNNQQPKTPVVKEDRTSAWAQYSIRIQPTTNNQQPTTNPRDELREKLSTLNQPKTKNQQPETNIPTAIHYPMPLHLQECFAYLGYNRGDFPVAERISGEILSLPMNPYLLEEEIEYVVRRLSE
jgi:UDP-2-acetamido-2-deoxy-ribo-hexuluronate aminotransferase